MKITKSLTKKQALELGKYCKKCGSCCSYGSGALVNDDLKKLASFWK